ncbi:MAG: tRNA lysidine(34) synthetase TilS [Neisseriaceae bacterium]|nr:tRNA lysidine(34) synthetase TilS [Neisseriaceae bacterium]
MDLYARFVKHVDRLPENDICVALRGGVDSVVLLHLLKRYQQQHYFSLSALYVHHGLNPKAGQWQDFCQSICQQWGIPFQAAKVNVQAKKLGIEAAARQARYRVFAQHPAAIMALAHHQNDQHETFLLAALRGGGVRALAAMSSLHQQSISGSLKTFWRPLLPFTRQEIEDYAVSQQLSWVHDDSNDNSQDYLRNFLRQRTLPELTARVPHLAQQLNATIAALQNDLSLLNELAEHDYQNITICHQWQQHLWQQLSLKRQHQQLAYFCKHHDLGTPTRASIENFARILRQAKTAQWQLPNGLAVLYQNVLLPLPTGFQKDWFWLDKPLSGSLKEILTQLKQTHHKLPEKILQQTVTLRSAQKNDTLLIAHQQHQSVYKILQQNGVPALLRPLWAVLANQDNQVIAVFNLRVNQTHQAYAWLPEIAFLNRYRVQAA